MSCNNPRIGKVDKKDRLIIFLDFANKMKNTTRAKILRNTCLVLFAEIIVSERNLMPGRQAYDDHPASVKLPKTNRAICSPSPMCPR